MATSTDEVTIEFLQDFAAAWTAHDLDKLMSFMHEDCSFKLSAGPDQDGASFVGYENVQAGYAKVLEMFPDGSWGDDSHFVAGDRGVAEWTFRATGADGSQVEVDGCDIFHFKGGKISVKNSFRKIRS